MTGYGRAERDSAAGRFGVEMRSVNHRFLELNLNLPPGLGERETELKALAASRLVRGRVDVWVNWERPAAGRYQVSVDRELVGELYRALEGARLAEKIPGEVDISQVARFAEAVRITELSETLSDAGWEQLRATFDAALGALDRMRVDEGQSLGVAIGERLDALETAVRRAEEAARELPSRAQQRLKERLAESLSEPALDEERLHMEVALLADKMDVTEEVVRLRAHVQRARELLETGGEAGKRLDFLVQEMAREANTLGSKARGLDVADPLVQMKSEIEKVREQARNLE
jgi:uncharacterized protein (TIGR00255 family)